MAAAKSARFIERFFQVSGLTERLASLSYHSIAPQIRSASHTAQQNRLANNISQQTNFAHPTHMGAARMLGLLIANLIITSLLLVAAVSAGVWLVVTTGRARAARRRSQSRRDNVGQLATSLAALAAASQKKDTRKTSKVADIKPASA